MRLPRSLKIVAGLFVAQGVAAIFRMLIVNRGHSYDLGFVDVIIGIGLLRLSPRALWWARLSLGVSLIALAAVTLIGTISAAPLDVKIGVWIPKSNVMRYAWLAVLVAVTNWQWRVLRSPEVVELIEDEEVPRRFGVPKVGVPLSSGFDRGAMLQRADIGDAVGPSANRFDDAGLDE